MVGRDVVELQEMGLQEATSLLQSLVPEHLLLAVADVVLGHPVGGVGHAVRTAERGLRVAEARAAHRDLAALVILLAAGGEDGGGIVDTVFGALGHAPDSSQRAAGPGRRGSALPACV